MGRKRTIDPSGFIAPQCEVQAQYERCKRRSLQVSEGGVWLCLLHHRLHDQGYELVLHDGRRLHRGAILEALWSVMCDAIKPRGGLCKRRATCRVEGRPYCTLHAQLATRSGDDG